MTSILSHHDHPYGIDAARLRDLLGNLTCPLCGGTRKTSLLVVVDAPASGARVRAQCVRCHLFWSFTLDANPGPTAPVASRSAGPAGAITAEEILELHVLLDHHQGSLEQLLWRSVS
jgi:hypothetical protein